jgi:N-acetyltransferase
MRPPAFADRPAGCIIAAMPAPITLTGRLVRLEPMREEHLGELLAAATEDRASFGYTYVPRDAAAVRRYLDVALEDLAAHVALAFTQIDLRDGRVVGSTRFRELEYWNAGVWPPRPGRTNPSRIPDAVEIGSTWLAPRAQRTGVNLEAKLLMLTHAFETWRVQRVSLKADTRNTRSHEAIMRLGATFEGTRRAHFPAAEGGVRDSNLYSLLAHEWPEAKERLQARLERRATPGLGAVSTVVSTVDTAALQAA